MTDSECVFCKIAAGEIPATKVYEDEQVLAFLDIGPLAEGHTLVIPKAHAASLAEMSPEQAAAVAVVLPGLARAVQAATGSEGLNVLQNNGRVAGQLVMHVHFHLIPRREGDAFGFNWPAGSYPEGRADALADAIRTQMAGGTSA